MKDDMMESQNIPWDAVSASLKNEADQEQTQQIQEWLNLSSEHPMILSEIMNVWSFSRNKSEFYQPDLTINWKKLMKRIDLPQKPKMIQRLYFRWSVAAAILVVVFLAGVGLGNVFMDKSAKVFYVKVIAPEGNKTQLVLPDSTHVWLNSGSELQYPSDYSVQNRTVIMKGECFFDVVKDSKHPFLVCGSKFQVKVFGTRFNVHEDERADIADVTLVSGKVQVLNLFNKPISELSPGEQLIYSQGEYLVQKAENVEALTAWMNNMLIFENLPFEKVVHYLEKWYGVNIHLDQSLYNSHNYTFKVKTESLREVLELISVITPIRYKIEGDQVFINNKKDEVIRK